MLNSHVQNINTTLKPSSSAECVIHYSDSIWAPASLRKGEVIMKSYHEIVGQVIMYLTGGLNLALVAIKK